MATETVKYFCGDVELRGVYMEKTRRFLAIGGKTSKHNYVGTENRLVGHPATGPDAILPVTRKVFYKAFPSLHKCDARCRHAKGHNCECSCGGKYHGAGD